MTDVLFYHLTEHTLERALPMLLEKSAERGWHAVVQTGTEDKCRALNDHLWTYSPDSFLAHGCALDEADSAPSETADAAQGAEHPIWLTTDTANPNGAQIRFIVDDAIPAGIDGYERVIYMFNGRDDDAVAAARERWKIEKAAGHTLTYWQQNEEGRWSKKG